MADSRKTVQIKSDPVGDVRIADEVVAIIAGLAATEVDGVSSMAGNITNEIVSKLGMKNLSKGIMIEIMDNEVKVDVAINIAYIPRQDIGAMFFTGMEFHSHFSVDPFADSVIQGNEMGRIDVFGVIHFGPGAFSVRRFFAGFVFRPHHRSLSHHFGQTALGQKGAGRHSAHDFQKIPSGYIFHTNPSCYLSSNFVIQPAVHCRSREINPSRPRHSSLLSCSITGID